MPTSWERLSPEAEALAGATARALLEAPGEILAAVDAAVLEASPVLGAHPELAAQAQASNHANTLRWLSSTAQRPGASVGEDLTPEALESARDVVRRGIDREVLWTAYRQGQNAAWRVWMRRLAQEASASAAGTAALPEALDVTARSLFAFVDVTLADVDARMTHERDQLIGGNRARQLETVRLILEDAPIPQRRAAERLGYELAGSHCAMVLWTAETDDGPSLLEATATRIAHAGGLRSPFTMPAGATVLWAWAAAPEPPDAGAMREVLATTGVRASLGSRAAGIAGFRQSHREAADIQRLVGGRRDAAPLTTYEEVEVVVLAAGDPDRAAQFTRAVLGPLSDGPSELRETLRVHLLEHRSAARAARRLFTHRNTVLNRVARAEALLPRPLDERPLAVALALELDHWLGFGARSGQP